MSLKVTEEELQGENRKSLYQRFWKALEEKVLQITITFTRDGKKTGKIFQKCLLIIRLGYFYHNQGPLHYCMALTIIFFTTQLQILTPLIYLFFLTFLVILAVKNKL